MQHWADPSVIARIGKWRDERHLQFVIFSDPSSFAWGGLFPKKVSSVFRTAGPHLSPIGILSLKPRLSQTRFFPFVMTFVMLELILILIVNPLFKPAWQPQPTKSQPLFF